MTEALEIIVMLQTNASVSEYCLKIICALMKSYCKQHQDEVGLFES